MAVLTCKQLCKLKEIFANLKCPDCFSTHIELCEEETEKNAECSACGCKFKFGPGFPEIAAE